MYSTTMVFPVLDNRKGSRCILEMNSKLRGFVDKRPIADEQTRVLERLYAM